MQARCRLLVMLGGFLVSGGEVVADAGLPVADYAQQIAPILTKYCGGCHQADDAAGDFALDRFQDLMKGGKSGTAIVPGSAKASRLLRLVNGDAEPRMPPKDNPRPTADEIALLAHWIDAGAPGPQGALPPPTLHVPKIAVHGPVVPVVNALATSPDGVWLAAAHDGYVTLKSLVKESETQRWEHQGNVNSIAFSRDSKLLVAAAGEPGLVGNVRIWEITTRKLVREIQGHRDSIYSAQLSPNGQILATAGYDRSIKLWDAQTGKELRTLKGHNGAVFELSFRNDGLVLASASADRTVKLWDVATGQRLDTLNQATKELYTVVFSPDGSRVAAGGVDNRIRVWQVSETAREGTNRLLFAVFAHDAAILRLSYSPDSQTLVSSGEDRAVKIWNAREMTLRRKVATQSDWAPAVNVSPDGNHLFVGRLDGTLGSYPLQQPQQSGTAQMVPLPETDWSGTKVATTPTDQLPLIDEVEPNDARTQATTLTIPGRARGVIDQAADDATDRDLFRIQAKKGEQWIVETKAARAKSKLDSHLAIWDANGQPVPRLWLRAVRDSEVTFRGINSEQLNCRLVNWEEMELNEYLYINGEVTKLFRKPQGPDSGFLFYPGAGQRYTYFDTSARSHALGEPAFIVVPYAVGSDLPDNGLPVFPLFYENDDDPRRELGDDSRISFTAPADGEYLVQVSDIRQLAGKDFHYELIVRRPQPNFQVTLAGANPVVNAGSGKELTFTAKRFDNFQGPIRIEIQGLPPGFRISSPITIEAGQREAKATLHAHLFAPPPTESNWAQSSVTATAEIGGEKVQQSVNSLGTVKLSAQPKVTVHLRPPTHEDPPTYSPAVKSVWETLRPAILKSTNGTKLSLQTEQSVLASDANPDSEMYTVVTHIDEVPLRAIRLDALGHATLPSGAPGRAGTNGNFVINDFRVTAISLADPSKSKALKFATVKADYFQAGHEPKNMVDDDPKTGWAVATSEAEKWQVKKNGEDPAHWAEFTLDEPLTFPGGTMLVIHIDQSSGNRQHNLGHFKLSTLVDRVDVEQLRFPEIPEVVIAPGTMTKARLMVQRKDFNARIRFNVNNLPHGVIVEDIGLNGVLLPEKQTERTIYLRAEAWVPETERLFHAVATVEGNQVSLPMRLRVRNPTGVSPTNQSP